jgi:hypothetical protein
MLAGLGLKERKNRKCFPASRRIALTLLAAGVARSTLTDYRPYKKATKTLIIQSDSTMMQRADRIAPPRLRLGDFPLMLLELNLDLTLSF